MVTRMWGEFVYAPPEARRNDVIVLDRDELHHLFRVRRVSADDPVWVTDGEGTVYRCAATAERALRILETHAEYGEPEHALILCLALLRGDPLREAVNMATQLGATRIILFSSELGEARAGDERLERLQRVAISAIKQCGRARLPQFETAVNLAQALELLPKESQTFLAHPLMESVVQPFASAAGSQALIVGPEGGLSDDEVAAALQRGCIPLTLARRRLRSETAVVAGLAFLLTRWGECG
jgi:16S rRNA (uracil1498-N3)-methyltransferase